jgi:hypothetical protein
VSERPSLKPAYLISGSDRPKVEIRDPMKPHRDLLAVYTDKAIHDVTAYLVTLK